MTVSRIARWPRWMPSKFPIVRIGRVSGAPIDALPAMVRNARLRRCESSRVTSSRAICACSARSFSVRSSPSRSSRCCSSSTTSSRAARQRASRRTSCCASRANTCATPSPSPRSRRRSCASEARPRARDHRARGRRHLARVASSRRSCSHRSCSRCSRSASTRRSSCAAERSLNDRRPAGGRHLVPPRLVLVPQGQCRLQHPRCRPRHAHPPRRQRLPAERAGTPDREPPRGPRERRGERLGPDRRACGAPSTRTTRKRPRAPSGSRRRRSTSAAHATSPCSTPASTSSRSRSSREYIAMRTADGRDPVAARSRLHRRLADPLTVTLFAWLALPLGFAVERTRSLAVSGLHRDRAGSASTTRCARRARCSLRRASLPPRSPPGCCSRASGPSAPGA